MLSTLLLLLLGFVLIIKGSDYFIEAAAYLARYFGVGELIVGLTVVSVGTSLPELGVSVYASYTGSGGIAVGNVVGSNIANVALILGLIILFKSIETDEQMLKRDGYFMLAVSILFAAMAYLGNQISRLDGLVLMVLFLFYMRLLYRHRAEGAAIEVEEGIDAEDGLGRVAVKLIFGGVGVFLGSRLLVNSALVIAEAIGVSEGVIGSTLVAFGTSVPELAVSASALKKGYGSISIGNIIGSNIFNILWVLGLASLVSPLAADNVLMQFNIPMMLFIAVLLLAFMRSGWKLGRGKGVVFLGLYIFFLAVNFWG